MWNLTLSSQVMWKFLFKVQKRCTSIRLSGKELPNQTVMFSINILFFCTLQIFKFCCKLPLFLRAKQMLTLVIAQKGKKKGKPIQMLLPIETDCMWVLVKLWNPHSVFNPDHLWQKYVHENFISNNAAIAVTNQERNWSCTSSEHWRVWASLSDKIRVTLFAFKSIKLKYVLICFVNSGTKKTQFLQQTEQSCSLFPATEKVGSLWTKDQWLAVNLLIPDYYWVLK